MMEDISRLSNMWWLTPGRLNSIRQRLNDFELGLAFGSNLNDMVKETSDGEGADATEFGGDGGEICAGADAVRDVAFKNAVFAGSASVDD